MPVKKSENTCEQKSTTLATGVAKGGCGMADYGGGGDGGGDCRRGGLGRGVGA